MRAPEEVLPSARTVPWGYFDGALPPVATIRPGDTIVVHTLSGGPEDCPPEGTGFTVAGDHLDTCRTAERGPGPHLLTGPVAVIGAEPGDALKVEILDVALRDDWGFNVIKPLAGVLRERYQELRRIHLAIDKASATIRTPWGLEVPARPFFGIMGTAPPRSWGRQTSIVPRAFGGNIDNKELTAGATLYLPVFEPMALFSIGDGHAAQGDGEVCLTAVETGLVGTFRIDLVKGAGLARPRAETATHVITMGFDEDLDDAAKLALSDMIALICERSDLTEEDAYRLCSIAADLRVTQLVNQHKGVHAMLPRWALGSDRREDRRRRTPDGGSTDGKR